MNIKKTLYSFIAMGCLISAQGYSFGGGPPVDVGIKPRPTNIPPPVHPTAPSVHEAARKQNEPEKVDSSKATEAQKRAKDDIGAP